MKKVFVSVVLAVLAAPAAFAAEDLGMRKGSYGLAGCGLGSMLWATNGKVHQVLAATTNGTFGTQTFGITTGTSNCTSGGVVLRDKEREMFVATNFESLQEEIAKGKGENLATLSHFMGCPTSSEKAFAKTAKSGYSRVISKAKTPLELVEAVKTQVASDPALVEVCRL